MVKKNACIFISGYGSNLKSLINSSRSQNFPVNISLVISNKIDAKGLDDKEFKIAIGGFHESK